MNILKQLFGNEDKFFNLLEASAGEANNSASLLLKALPHFDEQGSEEKLEELARSRCAHKRLNQEITQRLCTNFVTPLEREDIDALSHALYKITKIVEKIAERLSVTHIGIKSESVVRQAKMLESATEVVACMVLALRKRPHVEKIKDSFDRLQTIEGEADKLMLDLLRELYQGDIVAKDALILKDLFELLERAIDRCREAGSVVFQTVLKYS